MSLNYKYTPHTAYGQAVNQAIVAYAAGQLTLAGVQQAITDARLVHLKVDAPIDVKVVQLILATVKVSNDNPLRITPLSCGGE